MKIRKKNKKENGQEPSVQVQEIPEKSPTEKDLEALRAERARIIGKKRYRSTLANTVAILIVVAAISVLAATLWLPFLKIYGKTMSPSVNPDDIVMTVKQTDLDPGDIISFYYNNKLMIKRVIAEPGDIVDIDDEGYVSVNGEVLDEPYVVNRQKGDVSIKLPYEVPEEQYFVLSDDRSLSLDSRTYAIGSVSEELILGRLVLRIWPLNQITLF